MTLEEIRDLIARAERLVEAIRNKKFLNAPKSEEFRLPFFLFQKFQG